MPKFAANLTFLYTDHPFLDRFERARAGGFDAVEYMFPYAYTKPRLVEALERHGLTQVLLNLPAGDWEGGERGIACHPDRRDEFRDGVARAVEYATALGCPQVNCLIGIPPAGADPQRVHHTVVENLAFAAGALGRAGVRLLLEPVNGYDIPGFWLQHADQAVHLMDEVGSDNIWLQYDLYHQQRADGELAATWRRLKGRIAHVQVADNPGRNEPGTGEINYPYLFAELEKDGYAGWIGCEYRPRTETSAGLGWLAPYARTRAAA